MVAVGVEVEMVVVVILVMILLLVVGLVEVEVVVLVDLVVVTEVVAVLELVVVSAGDPVTVCGRTGCCPAVPTARRRSRTVDGAYLQAATRDGSPGWVSVGRRPATTHPPISPRPLTPPPPPRGN